MQMPGRSGGAAGAVQVSWAPIRGNSQTPKMESPAGDFNQVDLPGRTPPSALAYNTDKFHIVIKQVKWKTLLNPGWHSEGGSSKRQSGQKYKVHGKLPETPEWEKSQPQNQNPSPESGDSFWERANSWRLRFPRSRLLNSCSWRVWGLSLFEFCEGVTYLYGPGGGFLLSRGRQPCGVRFVASAPFAWSWQTSCTRYIVGRQDSRKGNRNLSKTSGLLNVNNVELCSRVNPLDVIVQHLDLYSRFRHYKLAATELGVIHGNIEIPVPRRPVTGSAAMGVNCWKGSRTVARISPGHSEVPRELGEQRV
ncbi:hypothetical protein B0T20DRAFT_471941 [Sordaria brevicollis]|uniref:Uncharacterized protein n=1 Tax=Sordaria brevicollis TaxID=83679 RepID=A0AAE0P9E8_SORBR|nr:hypothetical protein B0T20DRAFT_471941 [Sordaria brevicollis]